ERLLITTAATGLPPSAQHDAAGVSFPVLPAPAMPMRLLLALVGGLGLIAPAAADTYLVERGVPRAQIVIAEQPPRAVRLAAQELQDYIQKITGAHLPIVTKPEPGQVSVYVGSSEHTKRLGITAEGLKHGAYRIVSGDNYLV